MTNSLNMHTFALKDATILTIASGVVTATQQLHKIAAQTGTADDLDTISLGWTNLAVKGNTYRPMICLIADTGDTITLKDGTGNIALPGGQDVTLNDDEFVWLLWTGTAWVKITAALAAEFLLSHITGATYTSVQDMQNLVHSAGVLTWDGWTDNGDGTIDIGAGTGFIRATDDSTAELKSFDWVQDAAVSLTDDSDNWVLIDYNAGSPEIAVVTTEPTDYNSKIPLLRIYRNGTDLHVNVGWEQLIGDHAGLMTRAMRETMPFSRVSGGIISETGTRQFAITAGVWWTGLNRFTTDAFDGTADTFHYYWRDGGTGWTEAGAQTAINNTQYDDGDGTLGTLTANRYGVHWVYLGTDSDVHVVYGQGDYTLAAAQAVQPPASLPPDIVADSRLIGKIIIQKSASAFTDVESAFDTTFTPSAVSLHNELGGLQGGTAGEYYHLTSADYTALTTLPLELENGGTEADLSATGPGLVYQPSAGAALTVESERWASHADPLVLNTYFNIWQSGTSFTHTGGMAYWCDGWAGRRGNNAAGMTITRQTVEADRCRYAFRMQRDNGNSATDLMFMIQSVPVEQVIPVQGLDMTMALRIRAGADFSGTTVTIHVRYATTADVTPEFSAGTTALASDTITPDTSFGVFTLNFTVPTDAKNLQFGISYIPDGTAGAADYIEIDWVGTHFGPGISIEPKPLPRIADLVQCQQFYQKTYPPGTAPGAASSLNAVFYTTRIAIAATTAGLLLPAATKFQTQMRAIPTVTIYSVDGTSGAVRNGSSAANRTGCTAANIGNDGFAYIDVSNASSTVISLDHTIGFHYVANARL